ncbi:hypothetical protein OsI_25657 [Oryza sativa Indica Group]|uniref:F-box/LRR-repeat protein 15/At3g58940/PEG3-like LRR domain-containing protein n=1 Tax=Oryza sativa subsp. indica TaxID=39946 RepID=B8B573_ORYSI|nr:hypothetical protein OsI_25657 [Oryza sativa Indica Group]
MAREAGMAVAGGVAVDGDGIFAEHVTGASSSKRTRKRMLQELKASHGIPMHWEPRRFTNGNTTMTDQANYMSYLLVVYAFHFSSTLEVVSFSSCCLHDDMISQPLHFPKLRKLNLHSVNSSEDALHAMSARPLRASKSTTPLGCIIFASGLHH